MCESRFGLVWLALNCQRFSSVRQQAATVQRRRRRARRFSGLPPPPAAATCASLGAQPSDADGTRVPFMRWHLFT